MTRLTTSHRFSQRQWIVLLGLFLFSVILCPLPVAAGEAIQIKLLTRATVDGDSVLLGRIAEIVSEDIAAVDALRTIEIGRSPLPGQSLYIHPNRVNVVLKQNKGRTDGYQIVAAGPVKVVRSHDTVSADQIRSAVIQFIQVHAPWDKDQMKIRPIRYDQDHIVPPGKVALQITSPKHTDWLGAEPFKVRISVDGASVRRTAVPTYIEVWQDVLLAAKPLGRNQPVTQADIKVQKMDLARLPSNAVVRADQVIGKRAKRSIAINSILRVDQVAREPAVRKGDLVRVLVESSILRVSTQAVAKENGCVGERIRLVNVHSKKNIHAQIVDSRTVRVEF